jgi:hypothetical protein
MVRPPQVELLCTIVEADRNVLPHQRQPFFFHHVADNDSRALIEHPGLATGTCRAALSDLEELAEAGLIALHYHNSRYSGDVDVRSPAITRYEQVKRRTGQPLERLTNTVRQYLSAEAFQRQYPTAYSKWVDAETRLWASDAASQLTTMGHLCRESMQAFASALIEQHQPISVNPDQTKTVARLQAVLTSLTPQLGTTEKPFLDALIAYWGTVSDLVQRQEHGAQKEGQPLVWEDARRVVFQTAMVMFEVDSALSHNKAK